MALSTALLPLQGLPSLTGIVSALIVAVVVLLVGRFLLNVAIKIAVVAAVILGLIWLVLTLNVLPLQLVLPGI